METRDQDDVEHDDVEPAPPSWVLRTPTRQHEVWTVPLFTVALAVAVVIVGVVVGSAFGAIVAIVTGGPVAVGAVVLAVAGRRAFVEQSRAASWRFHQVGVLMAFGTGTLVALAALTVGTLLGIFPGVLGVSIVAFSNARSVPRFDRLVAAVTALVLAFGAAVLVVLGLTLQTITADRSAVWVGAGWFVAVIAAVVAVVQFRAAARAPRD
ncbi:hypothetical protein [Curtobacterium sp. VKM Ac-2922]|uniref:hypothetical protein n=1 Tax=Curtobacterium sp. VKM Ac-2922 TaxID=2929475 RepID=UPI001FB32377|nr:hypothetical protein [Curtobacterium sp. VKM Ac-2922]MCJ1715042.1 hypothetical protein [Curtobacterium sp. VKM Ac-2922]